MIDCEAVLDRIKKKIDRRMELNIPESDQYESCFSDEDGNYIKDYTNLREGYGWTRSFLTGAAAYMYFHYREEKYLDYLRRQLPVYDRYQYSVQDHYFHDTGFLFTLFSGALYEIAGDEAAYRMNIKAADDTLKGYVPEVGVVDGFSGGKEETTNPIIDDMMNISLLMWAWGKTNHYYYHRIFTNHIRNVKKYMLRDDFTFRHSFLFDSKTGEPLGERNFCGFAPGSVWARGQMWALYGMVNALKVTGEVNLYGDTINGQLTRLIALLDQDVVPLWDFDCISEKTVLRDSSAASIMAAALLKLNDVEEPILLSGKAKVYNELADRILEELVEHYFFGEDCTAILRNGQVGLENKGTVWGDYFLVEALMKKLYGKECPDFWVGNNRKQKKEVIL